MYITYTTPTGISTKTYPIPGYGYEVRIDLTQMSGKDMKPLQNSQNYQVRI